MPFLDDANGNNPELMAKAFGIALRSLGLRYNHATPSVALTAKRNKKERILYPLTGPALSEYPHKSGKSKFTTS